MGIVKAIVGNGPDDVVEALRSVPHVTDLRELDFRDVVHDVLASRLPGVSLQREAAVGRARVDLYAHYDGHDYLITIKKGLSSQKLKVVMGEIATLTSEWRPKVARKKTYVIFYPYALKPTHFADFQEQFQAFAEKNSNRAFDIRLEFPRRGG